jgi:hypothetical protein
MTTELKARLIEFTRRPLAAVVSIDEGETARLFEPSTGKELRFRWDELAQVEEKRSEQRVTPYLLVVWQDGRQVALADVGFAFAPSTQNTGPLPDLPAVLCFRDFRHLSQGIEQLLTEDGREKEALGGILICIALLDGARNVGLDVGREERRLDQLLKTLEQHGLRL